MIRLNFISLIFLGIAIVNCMGQGKEGEIHEKLNEDGLVVERWGNEGAWDNDINFREFFYYDQNGLIKRSLYYSFEDDNVECTISEFDRKRYDETIYEYDVGILKYEKKYMPILNEQNEVIGHKLYYIYNHITQQEDESSPSKQ